MSSSLVSRLTSPRLLKAPASYASYGDPAIRFLEQVGVTLFQWQQECLKLLLGVKADGSWSASEAGLLVSRQSGKSELLAAFALCHLFLFPNKDKRPKVILISAHEYRTATEIYLRVKGVINASTALSSQVNHIYDSAGRQEIILKPREGQKMGDRIKFTSRSNNSGRGFSAEIVIADEAQEWTVESYDSIQYTMSTFNNSQLFMCGTVPNEKNNLEVFEGIRDRGRSPEGEYPDTLWMEYSPTGAEDPDTAREIDPFDEAVWEEANPSIDLLISRDTIRQQLERDTSAAKESFMRERLSVWPSAAEDEEQTLNDIDLEIWHESADPRLIHGENLVLAVQVADNGGYASISACSLMPDGSYYVEHVTTQRQTLWVPGKLKALISELGAVSVILDEKKAAGIIPDLKREKIKYFSARPSEIAAGYSLFLEKTNAGQLVHRGQESLTESLRKAVPRKVGSYGFTWDQSDETEPVTPVASATLALFGCINYQNVKPQRGKARGFR